MFTGNLKKKEQSPSYKHRDQTTHYATWEHGNRRQTNNEATRRERKPGNLNTTNCRDNQTPRQDKWLRELIGKHQGPA